MIRQTLKTVCEGLGRSAGGGSVEISGLLLGRDLAGNLFITSAVTGDQVSTEFGSELDDNFMARVAQAMITGKITERIVGMFHSHPGIGVFLSQQDVRTLANFQRLYPRFVMMVIDPLARVRYRFFRYDTEAQMARPLSVELIE